MTDPPWPRISENRSKRWVDWWSIKVFAGKEAKCNFIIFFSGYDRYRNCKIYESCKKYHSLSSHKFPYSFKKDYGGDQDWKKEIIQSYYRIILLCRQRPEMWKQLTGFWNIMKVILQCYQPENYMMNTEIYIIVWMKHWDADLKQNWLLKYWNLRLHNFYLNYSLS